jgi:hypothetical protein
MLAKSVVCTYVPNAPEEGMPARGIFRYLSDRYCQGENVHDHKVVTIKIKQPEGNHQVRNVVDFGSNPGDYVQTANMANAWILLDLGKRRAVVTHYSIKSIDATAGTGNLKSWVLSGAIDQKQKWPCLDEVTKCAGLNAPSRIETFPVRRRVLCRYFRLTSTDSNHAGTTHLALARLEFYGLLVDL